MAIVIPVITTWDGRGLQRARDDFRAAETGFDRMAALGRGMQSVGRSFTAGITLPVAGLAIASTKSAATFESTMAQIASVSGETGTSLDTSMKMARDAIIEMGTQTIYSSQDAADAFLDLQKAGVDTQDVIGGALAAAMNLAATEGMGLAFAAKVVAQAMNAYKIPAKQAGRVTDILAAGAIASTASVEDLAGGLKYVSSTAAALGVPLDDTVVALAELNNSGLTATTAGTSLNQMMVALLAPTKAASKQMEALGFSVTDAQGNMKDMPTLLSDLDKSMAGMTEPQKQAALKTMFNTRGMRAANILLKEGSDGWEEMDTKVNQAGAAAKLADARMSGMAGTLERARGAAETASITFGNALAPVLNIVITAVTKFLNWFSKLPAGMQTAIAVFVVLAAVIGPIVIFVGMLITALSVIIPIIETAALVIGLTVAALGWWVIAIIAVIAAIVAIVVIVVKNWDKILDWTKKVWQTIVDTVKGWIDKFKQMFPETFAFITGVIRTAWNTIKTIFTTVLGTIWAVVKNAFTQIWNVIQFYVDVWWGIIKTFFTIIWELFKTGFKVVFTIIETVLGTIKALFHGDFAKVGEIVREGIGKIIKLFGDLPGKITGALGNLGRTLFDAGRQLIQGLIDGAKSLIGNLGGLVKDAVKGLNPFTHAAGGSSRGIVVQAGARGRGGRSSPQNVVVNITESRDPHRTARLVKRAIEGYDISQGRERGAVLAVSW